jgi:acetyl-CoA synthetase
MSYPFQIHSLEEYRDHYEKSIHEPESFWGSVAENFQWRKKWDKVLSWNFRDPEIQWFINGKLNITENCLDRHLEKNGDRPAILWESNDPEEFHRMER